MKKMKIDKQIVILALATCFSASPGGNAAAVELTSNAREIQFSGRVQTQFNTSSVDTFLASEFLVRRARFAAEVKLNDIVSGKVEPEYGSGKYSLKDGYMKLKLGDSFRVTFGQFKRPFDLFQLTSSTKGLVIERNLEIRGVTGLRSYSSLVDQLNYSGRDIGVGGLFRNKNKSLSVSFMVSNGIGSNRVPSEEVESRSDMQYTARIKIRPMGRGDLSVAAGASYRPYRLTATTSSTVTILDRGKWSKGTPVATIESVVSEEYSMALGFDLELGNYDEGFLLQAGVIRGENWEVGSLSDPESTFTDSTRTISAVRYTNAAEAPTFVGAQVMAGYKHLLRANKYMEAIEPVVRVSYADPNDEVKDDGGILVTQGIQTFFSGRNKIALNIDIFFPESVDESTSYSFKAQSYLYF